ncbi:MAG: hypothetical protein DRJ40_02600 [Thermoprotei archaeon]|nr:MAG: hypothetical protein DRJ40_02600 [Thermoprotei archaeon]
MTKHPSKHLLQKTLKKVKESETTYLVLSVAIPTILRTVPELIYPFPTGFDPLSYYFPAILHLKQNLNHVWKLIEYGPIPYILLTPLPTKDTILLGLKILNITAITLLALTTYLTARDILKQTPQWSFITTLLTTNYITMAFSWLYPRNTLAYALSLLTTYLLLRDKILHASLLTATTALTHPVPTIFIVTSSITTTLLRRKTKYLIPAIPTLTPPLLLAIGYKLNLTTRSLLEKYLQTLVNAATAPLHQHLNPLNQSLLLYLYLPEIPLIVITLIIYKRYNTRTIHSNLIIYLTLLITTIIYTKSHLGDRFVYMIQPLLILTTTTIVHTSKPTTIHHMKQYTREITYTLTPIVLVMTLLTTAYIASTGTPPVLYFKKPYVFNDEIYRKFPSGMAQGPIPLRDVEPTMKLLKTLTQEVEPQKVTLYIAFRGFLYYINEEYAEKVEYTPTEKLPPNRYTITWIKEPWFKLHIPKNTEIIVVKQEGNLAIIYIESK